MAKNNTPATPPTEAPQAFEVQDIIKQLPRRSEWPRRELSQIQDITIHHTAAPDTQTPQTLATWHLNKHRFEKRPKGDKTPAKPWPGIGYHYLIYPDGQVFQCNEDTAISYHNGFDNTRAIGVALVGNYEETPPSKPMMESVKKLIATLLAMYPSIKFLTGHREYRGKRQTLCPGQYVSPAALRDQFQLQPHPQARFPETIEPIGLEGPDKA